MRQNLFKGAAGEHSAAAYYIKNGCGVYWPSVPLACDLIVERSTGELHRIQVKYVAWKKHDNRGQYESIQCRTYGWTGGRKPSNAKPKYDFLFVVCEDGRMWEIPTPKLSKHGIKLETSGGKHNLKTKKKWDGFIVS